MSKKSRGAIRDNLARVLDPPASTRKRGAHLDGLLNEYAPPEEIPAKRPEISSPIAPSQYEPPPHREAPPSDEAPSPIEAQPLHREAPPHREAPSLREEASLLPASAPHLRFSYEVLDQVLAKLDPYPRAVLLRLYRLSAGWNSDTCRVSIGKLAEHCKMGVTKVRSCLRTLESEGYIKRLSIDLSNKNQNERGVTFKVLLPRLASPQRVAPSRREPNKEKALKENNIKGINRLTPEEIQSFTSTVVDLLGEGKSIEEVEASYASSMHVEDWAAVKSVALVQAGSRKTTA